VANFLGNPLFCSYSKYSKTLLQKWLVYKVIIKCRQLRTWHFPRPLSQIRGFSSGFHLGNSSPIDPRHRAVLQIFYARITTASDKELMDGLQRSSLFLIRTSAIHTSLPLEPFNLLVCRRLSERRLNAGL